MKKIFTKALSVLLAALMCLTVAPAFALAADEQSTPAIPVFALQLVSESETDVVVAVKLVENNFKCLDLELDAADDLTLTTITFLNGASGSSNIANGKISLARPEPYEAELVFVEYTYTKAADENVTTEDFEVIVTTCGVEVDGNDVDVYESVVVRNEIPDTHEHVAAGEWIETVPATCSTPGTEVRYCAYCSEVVETRETALAEHANTTIEEENATCTEDGYKKTFCNDCQTYIDEGEVYPATNHQNTTVDEVAPTCTEAGYKKVFCNDCQTYIVDETYPATEHQNTTTDEVAPTCTQAGYKKVFCNDCQTYIVDETYPATEHQDTTTDEVAPTCTEAGYKKVFCNDCQTYIVNETYDATGHLETADDHKDPTCTENGYDRKVCVKCGTVTEETVLEATGHGTSRVDLLLATCTQHGYQREICTVCNTIVNEVILESSGHALINDVKDPTCTEDGYIRRICTMPNCGHVELYVPTPHSGHHWLAWTVVTAPTYSKAGLERRICDKCGKEEERSIAKLVAAPTELIIGQQEIGLYFRGTARLFANVLPEEAAYSTVIIWESSNPDVATVDENGAVYANNVGTATITARTADGSLSATCEVTVTYSTLQWIIVYILFGWIWYL